MKRAFLILMIFALIVLSGPANAMTVRAEASPELLPGLIEVGQPFIIEIYMNNNDTVWGENPVNGYRLSYSMPFSFYSSNGSISNITHIDVGGIGPTGNIEVLNNFETFWGMLWFPSYWSYDGTLPDSLNFTGIGSQATGWPYNLGELPYFRFHFQGDEEGTFCIDSIGGRTGSYDWLLYPPSPSFNGPYCWEIGTLPTDPEIAVNLDSISFEATTGQSSPPAQTLNITNVGAGTLNWTASWNSSWLSVSPAYGTAPSNVSVFANISGMSSGTYYDTIVVSDPNATNNPVLVPVKLVLHEPPPTIDLSDDFFSFFAVADSTNPDDQFLTVTNVGGGTLNWTASHSQSWLNLVPASGSSGTTITLSIDITGLPYGIYWDTIVVSDPSATNDPQMAQVKLEISSSLPLLGVDPDFLYVVVDVDDPFPEDHQFLVYNEGAGSMNYYLEEHSDKIAGLTPDSGAVPQTVTVQFDSIPGLSGMDSFDTVWVYSDEASNSPRTVVIQYHLLDNPAKIIANRDTIFETMYECGQGIDPPTLKKLTVYNGGGEPFNFTIEHSASWLTLDPSSGPAPQTITLEYDYRSLSPGTYTDSLLIIAQNAINSPVTVWVVLTILPTDTTPEVYFYYDAGDSLIFAAQEEREGGEYFVVVNNVHPGCMDWQLEESVPWLNYYVDSSNNETYPWQIKFVPNGFGYTIDEYNDSGFVTSMTASNTPMKLNFRIYVWKFHGDLNWDGMINILDISYFIKYLYLSGPRPFPEPVVGDCNCDRRVDILDIAAIIDYLYRGAGPLCGNPY
jgi:hypothetical protein